MTTTPLLFGKYTVTTGTPVVRAHSTSNEFILVGKRGAVYRTYRPFGTSRVQFIAESGKFCAIEGNYHLRLDLLKQHAVDLTDADRI